MISIHFSEGRLHSVKTQEPVLGVGDPFLFNHINHVNKYAIPILQYKYRNICRAIVILLCQYSNISRTVPDILYCYCDIALDNISIEPLVAMTVPSGSLGICKIHIITLAVKGFSLLSSVIAIPRIFTNICFSQ